jgi:hypothetical protein
MPEERERQPRYSFGAELNSRLALRRSSTRNRKIALFIAFVAFLVGSGVCLYYYERNYIRNLLKNTPFELPPTTTQAYKWQAADGSWHLTSDPPPAGVDYDKLTVRSDTNIMPAAPGT